MENNNIIRDRLIAFYAIEGGFMDEGQNSELTPEQRVVGYYGDQIDEVVFLFNDGNFDAIYKIIGADTDESKLNFINYMQSPDSAILYEKGGNIFSITGTGLKQLENKINIVPNRIYYMGASSSPDQIIVTGVDENHIHYMKYPYIKTLTIEKSIGADLISRGTAAWLSKYANMDYGWVKQFRASFEDLMNGGEGIETNPDDLKRVQVLIQYSNDFEGDAYSEFERIFPHSLGGINDDKRELIAYMSYGSAKELIKELEGNSIFSVYKVTEDKEDGSELYSSESIVTLNVIEENNDTILALGGDIEAKNHLPFKEALMNKSYNSHKSDFLLAQAADMIAIKHGLRPVAVYDWAIRHNVDLASNGHVLAMTDSNLMEDVLGDKFDKTKEAIDSYKSKSKKEQGEKYPLDYLNTLNKAQLNDLYKKDWTIDAYHQDFDKLLAALNFGKRVKHLTDEEIDFIKDNYSESQNIMAEGGSVYKPLRAVKVTYSDGSSINTSMAAHLTDEEIRDYYRIGREFNIGSNEDNMQKVVSIEILDSDNIMAKGGQLLDIETDTNIIPEVIANSYAESLVLDMYKSEFDNWVNLSDKERKALDKKYKNKINEITNYLVERANTTYSNNESFRKSIRAKGNKGRDAMYTFMEHWSGIVNGKFVSPIDDIMKRWENSKKFEDGGGIDDDSKKGESLSIKSNAISHDLNKVLSKSSLAWVETVDGHKIFNVFEGEKSNDDVYQYYKERGLEPKHTHVVIIENTKENIDSDIFFKFLDKIVNEKFGQGINKEKLLVSYVNKGEKGFAVNDFEFELKDGSIAKFDADELSVIIIKDAFKLHDGGLLDERTWESLDKDEKKQFILKHIRNNSDMPYSIYPDGANKEHIRELIEEGYLAYDSEKNKITYTGKVVDGDSVHKDLMAKDIRILETEEVCAKMLNNQREEHELVVNALKSQIDSLQGEIININNASDVIINRLNAELKLLKLNNMLQD